MEEKEIEEVETIGRAIEREVVNKATGEVHKVLVTAFGEEEVIFTTEVGDITFLNPNKSGELSNEEWDVREINQ